MHQASNPSSLVTVFRSFIIWLPPTPISIWLYTVYHLILYPPFNPSSIPLHLPAACRTLTAQCEYQPLSGRRITAHGRLAGWPCPALPGIHAAAQLIQLACLAKETSAILITKWCILIPLTQSDCGKHFFLLFVCDCSKLKHFSMCNCLEYWNIFKIMLKLWRHMCLNLNLIWMVHLIEILFQSVKYGV